MLNIVKHKETKRTIVSGSMVLVEVSHVKDLEGLDWPATSGVVLSTSVREHALEILERIRRHDDFLACLIPIFMDGAFPLDKECLLHADGQWDSQQREPVLEKVAHIRKRIARLPSTRVNTPEEIVQYKLLSFLYTRNTPLAPITSRGSLTGYQYPLIDLLFKQKQPGDLLRLLERNLQQGFLNSQCLDHIHLCKDCNGSYLNFRELCPRCFSIDISVNDMIHHFVCAHVAPAKDFKTEDGLECPKCDKTLRHIGIDYDKPSSVFHCNSCLHEFQNPEMRGYCFDCNTENQLSELLHKTIGEYSITQKGEDWLMRTREPAITKPVYDPAAGMSEAIFRLLVAQEHLRCENNDVHSVLGSICFYDEKLDHFNDDLKKALQLEIGKVIKSYLQPADLVCSTSYNHYYFLLPDTPAKMPDRLETIQLNLAKLLSDNLEKEQLDIVINSLDLCEEPKLDEAFGRLQSLPWNT
ncbi:MAG: hypothetical protein AAF466_06075 [Bacteroidota bacterium]